MAFPSLLAVPAQVTLAINYSINSTLANGLSLAFKPTLADGTAFDLTAATSYNVQVDNGGTPGTIGYTGGDVGNTLVSATSSGGSLSMTAAQVAALVTGFAGANQSASGRLSITATDGTDTVIIARGQYSYQPAA